MRLPLASAGAAVRPALGDRDASVQRVAIHGAGLWRDREAVPALAGLLASPDAHVRRVAARYRKRGLDKTSTRIVGLSTLRVKECDRIAAPARELRKVGVDVVEGPDFIQIEPLAAYSP